MTGLQQSDDSPCRTCGAYVGDWNRHRAWHLAVADVWAWVDRVSGSSCEAARQALDRAHLGNGNDGASGDDDGGASA